MVVVEVSAPAWELILRLVLALGLGAALGVERESRNKTAGTRTHSLVALGAALFTVSGAFLGTGDGFTDRTRIAAQVVSGIGFIGGGAILRSGLTVTGITTAASLWMAASFGVAAGVGLYWVAAAGGLLTFIALFGLGSVADLVLRRQGLMSLEMVYEPGHGTLEVAFRGLRESGGVVRGMQLVNEGAKRHVSLSVSGVNHRTMSPVVRDLGMRDEVVRVASSAGES